MPMVLIFIPKPETSGRRKKRRITTPLQSLHSCAQVENYQSSYQACKKTKSLPFPRIFSGNLVMLCYSQNIPDHKVLG